MRNFYAKLLANVQTLSVSNSYIRVELGDEEASSPIVGISDCHYYADCYRLGYLIYFPNNAVRSQSLMCIYYLNHSIFQDLVDEDMVELEDHSECINGHKSPITTKRNEVVFFVQ